MVKEEGLDKLYLALAEGTLRPEGTIAEPLDGKESLTHCRLLYHQEGVSFAALYPITGRMHQIRRHLQVIGHPILGDLRYGGRQLDGWSGHALHSFRTALVHPETGRELVVYAPLPPDFIAYLRRFAGAEFTAMLAALPEIPPPLA
jgi:23S rRNA pseudouridine955/2504/2580 synthase